jgi:hypothetical protein
MIISFGKIDPAHSASPAFLILPFAVHHQVMGIFPRNDKQANLESTFASDDGVSVGQGYAREPTNYLRVPAFYRVPGGEVVLEQRFLNFKVRAALIFFFASLRCQRLSMSASADDVRLMGGQDALSFFNSYLDKGGIARIGMVMKPFGDGGGRVCEIKQHVWADTMRWMSGTKDGVMMLVAMA